MIYNSPATLTNFDRVTKLVQVTIWPAVLIAGVFIYRGSIDRVIRALVNLAEKADELKLWQLEIKRKVENVAAQTGQEDASHLLDSIPVAQRNAALEIKAIVQTAPSLQKRTLLRQSVRRRMTIFGAEYEKLREDMPSGVARTSAMNVVVAKMRSLGLAAKPFLKEFSLEKSAGMRLAAIAILQVSPSSDYLEWLFARFEHEQPFVFFQAALAVRQTVHKYGPRRPFALSKRINESINRLEAFKGGTPDKNTILTLKGALQELQAMHPGRNLVK